MLNTFRNQVLSNSGEERVDVNQRLLIDKILARYSSEFVVYRELMQNSDDAKSSNIQIIFETENNGMKDKVTRVIFKNNGFAFRSEDWNRLKKIAEGNPDEHKIGAFGVGFYSLFSTCEEPFVSSGGQGMAFYWRGNQLFTKHGPTGDDDKVWTIFLMDMREPTEFPNIEKFARFLANSLGFTGNLQEVSVYFNDTLVIQLSKKVQNPKLLTITSEFDTFSPQKIFHLTSVDVRDIQLDVRRLIVPTNLSAGQLRLTNYQTETASIFLRTANGNLDVKVSNEFSAEMERITKKKPPSKTTIQMMFTGSEEHNNLSGDDISPVFKDLLPYPEQGKIYIGFSTHQTTGCCSHLAARVIPTVERESIDLVEKTLSKYNSEMLSMAGTLCRILYEDEMDQITLLYNKKIGANAKDDKNTNPFRECLEKRAAHALTHFTFNTSTPNAQVGGITELQFFNCSKEILSVLSTNGVLPISNVRIPNSEMAGFIKLIPVVPKIIIEQCNTFFTKAKDTMKLIGELTLQDVLYELKNRIFSEDEMVELLKWWISYMSKGNNVNASELSQFMQLSRIGDKFQALNTFRYFLNPGIIPPDVDIPVEVLPYTISRNFKKQDLEKWFGWTELSLVDWAKFIVNKPDLETVPTFSKKVHQILAKNLDNTSKSNKKIIRQLFVQKKCIPTNFGMKIPSEAYFQNVNLFSDLPKIEFQKPQSVQNLMELLGVRKVVELKLIFDRLVNQGDWNHMQLVKYLVSILNNLEENEMKILKNKPIWPKENLVNSQSTKIRFIASDLYVPSALHREFGLPLIDWKGRWSHNTPEGKFLIGLGLQEYPTLEKILELAAHPTNSNIRSRSLKYFIDNFEEKYSKNYKSTRVNIAFLPCSDSTIYAKPSECFINPECKIMKFKVVHQDLQYQVGKFGVRQHPDHLELLKRLIEYPPQDENEAKIIFEYLASQHIDFINSKWNILNLDFIPIRDKYNMIIHISPRRCYLKVQKELNDFFSYVDFGEKANIFLRNCGVKDNPSPVDFAELLVKSSHELWSLIGDDVEKYLYILRCIAIDFKCYRTIAKNLILISEMKKAKILVTIKKKSTSSKMNDISGNKDNKEVNICSLASAKEIFINDDKVYQEIFNPLTAPEEDFLESLYSELGCRSLRKSVKETSIPLGIPRETVKSQQLQGVIIERACLFYFKCPEVNIERGEKWLKKLNVREIDHIETSYILETTEVKKNTDANIFQDKETGSWTLYITSKSNLLDISKHIAKNIYKSHEWNDTFCINTLLITPLSILKEHGYPVDRILKQSKAQHIIDQIIIDQGNKNNPITNIYKLPKRNSLFSLFSSRRSRRNGRRGFQSQKMDSNYNLRHFNVSVNIPSIPSTIITSETTQILRNCLQNAIKACHSNSGSMIDSQASIKIVNDDGSQVNYCCDIIPGYSLHCIGNLRNVELYISKGFDQSEILSQSRADPLNRFISILKDLADTFEITPKAVHIFYDGNANSIAFNRDGALFFNLKYYLVLHDEESQIKPTINVMAYWFMTFCHELAHNLIKSHDADHEHYFSSFAENYMSNFFEMIKKRGIGSKNKAFQQNFSKIGVKIRRNFSRD